MIAVFVVRVIFFFRLFSQSTCYVILCALTVNDNLLPLYYSQRKYKKSAQSTFWHNRFCHLVKGNETIALGNSWMSERTVDCASKIFKYD